MPFKALVALLDRVVNPLANVPVILLDSLVTALSTRPAKLSLILVAAALARLTNDVKADFTGSSAALAFELIELNAAETLFDRVVKVLCTGAIAF